MMNEPYNINTKNGTFGGICLVLLININWHDIAHSMMIAAVGAATSFIVSYLLNKAAKKWDR